MKLVQLLKELEVNNPSGYKITDWVKKYWDDDYEEWKENEGEDTADAVFMTQCIIEDKDDTITKYKIANFLKHENWKEDWSVESLLAFLTEYNIIYK